LAPQGVRRVAPDCDPGCVEIDVSGSERANLAAAKTAPSGEGHGCTEKGSGGADELGNFFRGGDVALRRLLRAGSGDLAWVSNDRTILNRDVEDGPDETVRLANCCPAARSA
jgi:hypothetical protein